MNIFQARLQGFCFQNKLFFLLDTFLDFFLLFWIFFSGYFDPEIVSLDNANQSFSGGGNRNTGTNLQQ